MKFADLVRQYSTTTGTGAFSFSGTPVGARTFASVLSAGDTFYYSAVNLDKPAETEVGIGTWQAGGTFTRNPAPAAATNFSAGTKSIALTVNAAWFTLQDAGGGGAGLWGSITGVLTDQLDLAAALAAKADDSEITTINAALAGKEPLIAAGTTSQYRRGDKTWQTLDKAAVGLGNVDNTADAAKNVLSATKLTTARTIQGVSFDGSANITLPAVTSGAAGLAPASGGGTVNFLRADGTWAAPPGGGGGGTWGSITGTLSSQTDLQTALNGKAATGAVTANGSTMTSARLLGRTAAGTGNIEELTATTAKSFLAIVAADVGGLTYFATGTDAANLTGTVAAARLPAFTGGDVTSSVGTVNLSIGAGAVTLAKMANVATGTIFYRKTAGSGAPEVQTLATLKTDLGLTGTNSGDQFTNVTSSRVLGRITAGFGAAEELTGTQVTSLLDLFNDTTKGVVPASGGGTDKFLRADGTWIAPITVGTTAPSSPVLGQLWVDTN